MKNKIIRRFLTALLPALLALGLMAASALAESDSGEEYIERSWSWTEAKIIETKKTIDYENSMEFPWYYASSFSLDPGFYVVNKNLNIDGRVFLKGDTEILLMDGFTLNVKGLYIPAGKTLKIYGQKENTGKLVSYPSGGGAGIGATRDNQPGGNIEIHGGIIDTKGDKNCAGIGSNDGDQTSGSIRIFGGTVKATGGESGAGIGAGRGAVQGNIIIYGGKVRAEGGHYAAGIGGGNGQGTSPMKGGHAGIIDIYGGIINAKGGDDGAGIGGGEGGNCGVITIHGGTIERAKGGNNGAGIGGGECEHTGDGGSITIHGGTVNA